MALSKQDLKEISEVVLSVVEKCLKNINQLQSTSTTDLMNVDEVSEKLKLGKQSVYKLIKDNQIESMKIGKNLYVKKSDFNNYINSK